MASTWTPEEEARRLAQRFQGVNQAQFARDHRIPGGPSMVSQHIKGRRPINLDSALAYARGFGVSLEDISPRLATQAHAAAALQPEVTGTQQPRAAQAPSLNEALPLVLAALKDLPSAARAEMASRWAALLLAPDSQELQQWLAQTLAEPRKTTATHPQAVSESPRRFAA